MTRARDTAGIIQYNVITVDSNDAVGIGSSIPDAKLDINGGLRVTGVGTFENSLIATGTDHDINGAIALDHVTVSGIATISSNLDVNGVNHDINGAIALDHVTVSGIATISSNLDVNGVNHDINGAIALDHVTVSGIATISSNLDVNGVNHDINGAIALDHVTVSGIVTATSFSGDSTGLTGTPNISVGVITASQYDGNFILDSYLFIDG
jgi:hypothetical protein